MQYEHLEYTPYGELWVDHSVRSVGAYPTVFRFTAHERDPETGFTYAGARYLDPRTSRWISADPAMWEGDYFPRPGQGPEQLGGLGGIFNIVNMHVFHYAGNNPVKYVDPDGRFKFLAIPLGIKYGPAIIAACAAAATTIAALPLFSRIGDAISWAVEAGRGRSGAEQARNHVQSNAQAAAPSPAQPPQNGDDNEKNKGNMRRLDTGEIERRTGTNTHDVKNTIRNQYRNEIRENNIGRNFDLYENNGRIKPLEEIKRGEN